ncbi:MAG: hypothetical protein WBP81_26830 [Solirubrobacteraceae bacterium]
MQYFEFAGSRAIYKEGWWACAKLERIPWDFSPETMKRFAPGSYDPTKDGWELYYLPEDFSQAKDLAAEHPDKLKELQELFWQEAERNRVLPLLGSMSIFFGILPPLPTITRFTFSGDVQNVQRGMVPRIQGRSYAIEAALTVPDGCAEGVIVANADFIGGCALWVDGQRLLNHTYSFLGVETYKQTSTEPIPTDEVTVKMLFEADENKPGNDTEAGNVRERAGAAPARKPPRGRVRRQRLDGTNEREGAAGATQPPRPDRPSRARTPEFSFERRAATRRPIRARLVLVQRSHGPRRRERGRYFALLYAAVR